jgi:hypothetical protein
MEPVLVTAPDPIFSVPALIMVVADAAPVVTVKTPAEPIVSAVAEADPVLTAYVPFTVTDATAERFMAAVYARVPPAAIVILFTCAIVGCAPILVVVAVGMITSSAATGTCPQLQFPAVFHPLVESPNVSPYVHDAALTGLDPMIMIATPTKTPTEILAHRVDGHIRDRIEITLLVKDIGEDKNV